MSREIRFRVWNSQINRYDRSHAISCAVGQVGEWGRGVIQGQECFTVEQWTGLVANQDIYEGDIVTFETYGHPHGPESDHVKGGVVWWDKEEAAFTFGRWTHPNCDEPFDFGYAPCQIQWSTIKVIGNIHENGDLISP